jgi:hypothetical protein
MPNNSGTRKARARYSAAMMAMNASIQRAVALLSLGSVSRRVIFSVTIGAATSRAGVFNSIVDSSEGEFMGFLG